MLIFICSVMVLLFVAYEPPVTAIDKPLAAIDQGHVQDYQITFQELEIDYKPTEIDLFKSQLAELNDKEKSIIENIKMNKGIYSLDPTCDWRIIGAIHFRETNLGIMNGWNGQGAFQNVRNRYEPNSQVTDWSTQVTQACNHLKQKVGTTELITSTPIDVIGTALARYNGCNNKEWKSCGYTAYKLSNEHLNFTKCSVDFSCLPLVPDYRLGTVTIYLSLMNDEPKSNFNCIDSMNC